MSAKNPPSPASADGIKPADVAAYYDAWTDRYTAAFGDAIQAHRPKDDHEFYGYLMQRSGLRDGKRALDAGCGVCGPSCYFARHLDIEIEALTLSPLQAETARQRVVEQGLDDRIRITVGDFHDLGARYQRESFDLVFFLESLSHSVRPTDAIAAAYEVLAPGGIIYIKDYFIRPCEDPDEQTRVLEVIERVDRLFATKTAWSADIIRHLTTTGFLPLLVEPPRFQDDVSRWQQFERDNDIDLFDGAASFHWSEWLELKFQKP